MHFRGTLLKRLEDQADRDQLYVDPKGVRFHPGEVHTIFRNFSYVVPDDVMGSGVVSRAKDGSLVVEGELLADPGDSRKLAIGIAMRPGDDTRPVRSCELLSVCLTHEHQDPTQPPIVLDGR